MDTATLSTLAFCLICHVGIAAEPVKLPHDTYSGYFVSNKFEPKAAQSFVVISDQEQFDKVFAAAFVMNDKSPRLPEDAFKTLTGVLQTSNWACKNRGFGAKMG